MRRRRVPSHGREVFPIRKSEQIGQTPLVRCRFCRHPNDTRKTGWSASGDGLGPPTDVVVSGETQENTKDRANAGGCPVCGSLNWHEGKPTPLPDDRDKPSDEWRTNRRRR
jgi:hypothetical protein